MPSGFYDEVVKEIASLGFVYLKNAKGSHEKWRNEQGTLVIVPRNLKSRHTANGILRDAGSKRRL